MNHLRACLLLSILVCAGGQNVRTVQKTGTELTGDKATTQVKPEEYDQITPKERQRINACGGVDSILI